MDAAGDGVLERQQPAIDDPARHRLRHLPIVTHRHRLGAATPASNKRLVAERPDFALERDAWTNWWSVMDGHRSLLTGKTKKASEKVSEAEGIACRGWVLR